MKDTMSSIDVLVKHNITKKTQNECSTSNPPETDDHDIWAKLLASKVRRMSQENADQFKLEVDTKALQFLSMWAPTTMAVDVLGFMWSLTHKDIPTCPVY